MGGYVVNGWRGGVVDIGQRGVWFKEGRGEIKGAGCI